jgi:hypothetical protein
MRYPRDSSVDDLEAGEDCLKCSKGRRFHLRTIVSCPWFTMGSRIMIQSDYWAQTFCLACVLYGLFRLVRTDSIWDTPAFMMLLVFLVPSSLIWLCSWFSAWPFYYPLVCGWLAASAVEATWRITYTLYHEERSHARWIAAAAGVFLSCVILYRSPSYPKFPDAAYLISSLFSGFSLGCLAGALIYWWKFPSVSVRKFVGHGVCLALYAIVLIEASTIKENVMWHATMLPACLGRGLLLVIATQFLTHRKADELAS